MLFTCAGGHTKLSSWFIIYDLCDFFRFRREARASFGGADPPPGRKKIILFHNVIYLLVNSFMSNRLRREMRMSPRGVTPDRAQVKPFHGLRIALRMPRRRLA